MNSVVSYYKYYLISIILISVLAQLPAQSQLLPNKVKVTLSELHGLASKDASGEKALKLLNESNLINNDILPYFYGIQGGLHQLTPDRQKRVAEVENTIAPFTVELLGALERSKASRIVPNPAAQMLAFTKADEDLKSKLQAFTSSESASPEMIGEAYNVIFMLQLDDEALRQEVVSKFVLKDQPVELAALGSYLLEGATTRWALLESEEFLRKILSVPLMPQNYPVQGGRQKLITDYNWAIEGLSRYGVVGAASLDLLKARMLELNREDPEEAQLAQAMMLCKDRLEGKSPPELAVNWKGQLLGVNKRAMEEWQKLLMNSSTNDKVSSPPSEDLQSFFAVASSPSRPIHRSQQQLKKYYCPLHEAGQFCLSDLSPFSFLQPKGANKMN